MFYVFHQNNNYGKYLHPAREVAIEADSEDEAREIYSKIEGVYFKDTSDKDCHCCYPRWSKVGHEYTAEEFQTYLDEHRDFMVWLSPKVPMMHIQYRDGSTKIVDVQTPVHAPDMAMDAPVPMPQEESAQECAAPVEDEKDSSFMNDT